MNQEYLIATPVLAMLMVALLIVLYAHAGQRIFGQKRSEKALLKFANSKLSKKLLDKNVQL